MNCTFCNQASEEILKVCCSPNIFTCQSCLNDGKVTGSLVCDMCHKQLGMKVNKLITHMQNMTKTVPIMPKRTIYGNNQNMGAYEEDHQNTKTRKKAKVNNMGRSQQQQYMQNYNNQPNQFGFYQPYQNQCFMPPNFQGGYMNGFPPQNYPGYNYQQNYSCFNGQMMPLNYNNYHPNMMPMQYPPPQQQNSFPYLDDQQMHEVYRKLTQGQRRPYNPHAMKYNVQDESEEQQERMCFTGQGTYLTQNKFRNGYKTTDSMEQVSQSQKTTRMSRSNSLTNMSLRR